MARQHRPDLILLDLDLPDIRGDVVLSHLQSEPELREIPVVVISGDSILLHIERLLELGATRYLSKPFDVFELLEGLEESLARQPH